MFRLQGNTSKQDGQFPASTNIDKYRYLSTNVDKYRQILNNVDKYQEMLTYVNKCQIISPNIDKHCHLSTNIDKYRQIPKYIDSYRRMKKFWEFFFDFSKKFGNTSIRKIMQKTFFQFSLQFTHHHSRFS